MSSSLSEGEIAFIRQGCALGIRSDGRGPLDFRTLYVENNVFPHCNGSCRVKIGDHIDVICSVKAEISNQCGPNANRVDVSTEVSPSFNFKMDEKKMNEIGNRVSDIIHRSLVDSGSILVDKLTIIDSIYCWKLYIDLLIIKSLGDPVYPASLAVYCALQSAKVPQLSVTQNSNGDVQDFDIISDISQGLPLPLNNPPILLTISKIGEKLVIDCDIDETACSSANLHVAINALGECCGVFKHLGGIISPHDITQSIQIGVEASSKIISTLDDFRQHPANKIKDELYPDLPPLRLGLLA